VGLDADLVGDLVEGHLSLARFVSRKRFVAFGYPP
jgi:hypothetical protein